MLRGMFAPCGLADTVAKDVVERARKIQLHELRSAGVSQATRITKTEHRAITVPQLNRVLKYIDDHCVAEGWTSTNPNLQKQALDPKAINLYDLVYWLVKPATYQDQCSYVELVAESAQPPKWFVSHWWGEATADFIRCLGQHLSDRKLPKDSAYWVCAYANNQWDLGGDVSVDPAESSFRKAMNEAQGTVTVLDAGRVTYTRVWCIYEIFISLLCPEREGGGRYLYDIYTTITESVVGLTDGAAECDMEDQPEYASYNKNLREEGFPLESGLAVLDFSLTDAKATQESDRKHILNSIVGRAGEQLEETPLEKHERYEQVNRLLRGRLAQGIFRLAIDHDSKETERLVKTISDSGLKEVHLSFASCKKAYITALADALSFGLQRVDLNLCHSDLRAEGAKLIFAALRKCRELHSLRLDLGYNRIGDEAYAAALADGLPSSLQQLDLVLEMSCLGTKGAKALFAALRGCLKLSSLELGLRGNKIGDEGKEAAQELEAELKQRCKQVIIWTGQTYPGYG